MSTRDLARDFAAIREGFSTLSRKRFETRPSNLPTQRTAFVGRDKEVAAAQELLLRQDVRFVTVTGPGGIGKTRFALQVARNLADQFPAGVFFVPLASISDAGLVPQVIAQTLGLRETGAHAPLDSLKEYLRNCAHTPMLLLLDNFEHLLAATTILPELLAVGSSLKIVITSRAALAEQAKLEQNLEPVRQSLGHTAGTTAWLEGWVMPLEKAIDEALSTDSAHDVR